MGGVLTTRHTASGLQEGYGWHMSRASQTSGGMMGAQDMRGVT